MWKAICFLIALLCAGLVGYIISGVQIGGIRVAAPSAPLAMSYSDMVSISLTVFGVIIAVASIALGVAGVIGWNSIEGKAMNVAERVTNSNLNDEKSSLHRILREAISDVNSPLHQTLKAEAQKAMFAGVQGVEGDHDELDDVEGGGGTNAQ